MTEPLTIRQIAVTGASTIDAIGRAMNAVLELTCPAAREGEGNVTVRIQAQGDSIVDLIPQLLDRVLAVAEDFAALPDRVRIDGIRPIEHGYRAWGVVEIENGDLSEFPRHVIVGNPVITDKSGQIEVSFRIELPTGQ